MCEIVSFELAKKLKEKGFPQKTAGRYNMIDCFYHEDGKFFFNGGACDVNEAYTAPTISQVLKWLREEKKIHVEIDIMKAYPEAKLIYWGYNIVLIDKYEVYHFEWNSNSFEQAALAGIEYVLNNLL
jgi:hypothetical protein